MGYYIMAFRTSLGDFELDSYDDDGKSLPHITLRWIIWIISVLIINIVFMNFIIAVISESYEKVMQKYIALSYKVKVDMIAERELFFDEKDLSDNKLFPKYLILRKPVRGDDETGQDWQGFIKDLKTHTSKVITKTKGEIQSSINMIKTELDSGLIDITKIKQDQVFIKESLEDITSKLKLQDDKFNLIINTLMEK